MQGKLDMWTSIVARVVIVVFIVRYSEINKEFPHADHLHEIIRNVLFV